MQGLRARPRRDRLLFLKLPGLHSASCCVFVSPGQGIWEEDVCVHEPLGIEQWDSCWVLCSKTLTFGPKQNSGREV